MDYTDSTEAKATELSEARRIAAGYRDAARAGGICCPYHTWAMPWEVKTKVVSLCCDAPVDGGEYYEPHYCTACNKIAHTRTKYLNNESAEIDAGPCPACKGSGDGKPMYRPEINKSWRDRCFTCNGTGRIASGEPERKDG